MKIAVCVDNNEPSDLALNEALELVDIADKSQLTIIHSVKDTINGSKVVKGNYDNEKINRAKSLLNSYVETVEDMGYENIEIKTELITTDKSSVESISDYVSDNGYDHIYIGHRAMDRDKEKIFGSFAKKMIRYSDVPVTVVS